MLFLSNTNLLLTAQYIRAIDSAKSLRVTWRETMTGTTVRVQRNGAISAADGCRCKSLVVPQRNSTRSVSFKSRNYYYCSS